MLIITALLGTAFRPEEKFKPACKPAMRMAQKMAAIAVLAIMAGSALCLKSLGPLAVNGSLQECLGCSFSRKAADIYPASCWT